MNRHKMVASNLCEALKSLTGATESCGSVNFSCRDALFQITNQDKAMESFCLLLRAFDVNWRSEQDGEDDQTHVQLHVNSPEDKRAMLTLQVVQLRPIADDSITQNGNALAVQDTGSILNLLSYPYPCYRHWLNNSVEVVQDSRVVLRICHNIML